MEIELTQEERLIIENIQLKQKMLDMSMRQLLLSLLKKHSVPEDATVSLTATHLLVSSNTEKLESK